MAELQRRYDAQSKELGSVRSSLQTNKSLFEEKDPTITTLTAEVDQWKLADAPKAKQFAAEHHDKEKFQRDLAAFSSQTADLQKRYDAQSKDIVAIRGELQTKTSLLEEKEHTITSLTTGVAQARREDSAKAEQIAFF
jgi:chromosome segregation ATPase